MIGKGVGDRLDWAIAIQLLKKRIRQNAGEYNLPANTCAY
jgi:hypothetical protein